MGKRHTITKDDFADFEVRQVLSHAAEDGKRLVYLATAESNFTPQFILSRRQMDDQMFLAFSEAIRAYNEA